MHRPSIRIPLRLAAAALATLLALAARPALAEWLQPDASYREALVQLRYAARDTAGHADDTAKLDSLGAALMRVGRVADARKVFERVMELKPGDPGASAGLGKLAMWADRLAEAESLLTAAGDSPEVVADLYATKLRRRDWAGAAALAELAGDEGRKPLLEQQAQDEPVRVTGERASVSLQKVWPAPLVRVKLNGTLVLMLVDTGTPGVLIDKLAATQRKVTLLPGQRLAVWGGTRVAVRNAKVARLEIGDVRLEGLPAGVMSLHKFSMEVNPQEEEIAGVIGLDVLRRFDVTMDFGKRRFELAPLGSVRPQAATKVPFESWGEGEVTVWGSMQGGRRMAMMLSTGLPGAGVGAPAAVFEEVGLKPGGLSKAMHGAGAWLNGSAWAPVGVPSLTLGALAFDKQPGWSGAMDPSELWRHGVRRDAVLGPGVLLKRRVTFDWTQRVLHFEGD
ncbi:MAG TPA: aspartyl protease family protein, partial [Gemmatimonadales bacterium]|nr:aspartyl protease family protein [Gemmatimonadales bacterium]